MADKRATQKVDPTKHEKMKEIVKMKGQGTTLYDEYDLAISNHIKRYNEEKLIEDSMLEKIIDEKLSKIDKHLSSMLGRTGMDTSMILQGLIIFLEHYFKQATKEDIFIKLRTEGARYYTQGNRKKK